MKNKFILSALLAAGLAAGAHANVSSALPDLLVGFQQSGTPSDYEADLGSIANYLNLAPNTLINLSSSISATDLSSLFGSSALTGGTVTWGGAATVGNPSVVSGVAAKGTFITQFDSIAIGLAPSLTPPASQFKDAGTSISNTRYLAVQNLYGGLNGQASLSTPEAASVPTNNAGSYSHWMNSSTVNGFGAGFDAPTALSLSAGQ